MPIQFREQNLNWAITSGLVLVVSLLGVLAASAQATAGSNSAASNSPATSTNETTSTNATTSSDTASVPASDEASPTDYVNWVDLGGGNAFVSGDKGEYKHQQDTNSGPFGGIDDFHFQEFVGKSGTYTMDGHAIFGDHDYDLHLDLTEPDLGYIRAGYTDFRTWYDGTGGYSPLNGLDFQPYNNELYIDRRFAWIEAGLTLPDLPAFILRYEFDSRKGDMDSTSWGQTTLTPTGSQIKIVPSFLGINETRNIFSADIKDKIDDTDADLGVRYEVDQTEDASFFDQNPTQAANALITQNDFETDDMFTVHGSSETYFDKKVTFTTGFSATTIDSSLGGNRIYGPVYNASLSPTFANNGSGFVNLGGGGSSQDYVGNLNLMLTPINNLVFIPSARVEYEGDNLMDTFQNTAGTGKGFTVTPETANTGNWYMDVTQSLENRYTGFPDWSLYSRAEVSEDWGNQAWNSVPTLDQVNLNQNWNMLGLKCTVGANWYPLSQLNFGVQYYHELHDYNYTNNLNPSLIQYPGYLRKQNFSTDDMNIRSTWQALSTLSLITRYDFQYSYVDTWSIPVGGTQAGGVESSDFYNHSLGEDITWTPLPCLYLQVGGSYVLSSLNTPVAGSAGINNVVQNGQNDYWTIDASAGFEIDPKTHFQVDYTYYNADDYYDNAVFTQPFGAGEVQNSVTATLTRDITKQVQVSVKYGFYQDRNETNGGQSNYDAHLIYVSTHFRF